MDAEDASKEGVRFLLVGSLEHCGVESALACRNLKQLLVVILDSKALCKLLGNLFTAAAKFTAN